MPIGTSDGEYFDNKFEAMVGSGVTAGLKRIPIVRSPEVVQPPEDGDFGMVVDPNVMQQNKNLDQIETDPAYGLGLDVNFRRPLQAPTEPAGAFKSAEATTLPPLNNFDVSAESDLDRAPFGVGSQGGSQQGRGVGEFLRSAAESLVTLPRRAIENSQVAVMGGSYNPSVPVEAALTAVGSPLIGVTSKEATLGSGVIKGKNDAYINMFMKPKPKAGSFDYEQMGNGKFEVFDPVTGKTHATVDNEQTAKYLAKEFNPQTLNPSASQSFLEQVPFGYSEGEWSLMSPYQKKKVLDNPPVDNTEKILAEIAKLLDAPELKVKKIPITESGKIEKLSPKEAFKQGFQNAKDQLTDDLNLISAKFKKAIKGPPEEVPGPKVSGKGDYTEPAYRGLSIYPQPGNVTNPVFKFTEEGAMYSTAHPQLADMYAGYLNTHPGVKVPEGTFPAGAQVMPLLINTKDYHYFDAKGAIWQDANPKAIIAAKDAGKKGVIVDNVWDEPNSTKNLSKPNKVYITFPKGAGTVKSRFAEKFDESSPNIMHGIATVGIGTAVTGYIATEEQPPNL